MSTKLQKSVQWALTGAAVGTLSYQILLLFSPLQTALEYYTTHLCLIVVICALSLFADHLERHGDSSRSIWGFAFLVPLTAVVVSTVYFLSELQALVFRQPFLNLFDIWAAASMIVAVLVVSWFVWGKILTGVMILAVLYFLFGDFIPGRLGYTPPDLGLILTYLAGIGSARGLLWGIPLSAEVIFMVIVFGGAMKGTSILHMFNEIGKGLMWITKGGICYSAILTATALGLVMGQPVSNVALAGSVTIPTLKNQGLSAEQSGSLVVLASLGSQMLPPIMGLAGFLIAVNLGIPYVEVAAAAVIPAVLYMLTIVVAAFFIVRANPQLTAYSGSDRPDFKAVAWILPSFIISFGVLIYLLYLRYSPGYAAFWALACLAITTYLRPSIYRPSFKEFFAGLLFGVKSAASLGLILAGIGLVIQVLITTGAGFDLGRMAMHAAGDSVWLVLIFGMLIALFAGMGLPTPAAYALMAIIIIPFMIEVGVESMAAHFFGFYFAIFSAITPPVAVACMASTRIAGGSFLGTAVEAGKVALISILIPYAFVMYPSLLGFPTITGATLGVTAALMLATVSWGAGIFGVLQRRLNPAERIVACIGPLGFVVLLVTQNLWFGVIPLVTLVATFVMSNLRVKSPGEGTETA